MAKVSCVLGLKEYDPLYIENDVLYDISNDVNEIWWFFQHTRPQLFDKINTITEYLFDVKENSV